MSDTRRPVFVLYAKYPDRKSQRVEFFPASMFHAQAGKNLYRLRVNGIWLRDNLNNSRLLFLNWDESWSVLKAGIEKAGIP